VTTTTAIPFTPSSTGSPPFSTPVTLDGVTYTLSTVWNIYAQCWYVSLATQGGVVANFGPLIGSPAGYTIPMFPGEFATSVLSYVEATATFVVTTAT
jgi:hypothetical protein